MYELKNISALSCFQGQYSVSNFVSIHLAERVKKIKKKAFTISFRPKKGIYNTHDHEDLTFIKFYQQHI